MDRSINLLSLITLYATFLGFLLTFFFLFVKSEKNKANKLLALLIFSFTTYMLPIFIYLVGLLEVLPHIIRTYLLLGFLVGPLIYFYVRATTQKGFILTPKLYLHFVPFVLGLIYLAPTFMVSGSEKIASFHQFFSDSQESSLPVTLITLQRLHGLIYFFFAIRVVWSYRNHLNNTSSSIDTYYHRWLLFFCSSLLIPAMTSVPLLFIEMEELGRQFYLVIYYGSFLVLFLVVLIYILSKPEIFHAFPHQMPIPDSAEEKTNKYESSNLQETQKEVYLKKLLLYVDGEKPYLENELTISHLSEQTKIPAHYLSQIINEKLNCNFLDFINGYRVNEAKAKLSDPNYNHYTIVAIAYEAGFNSKSAFYSAFKKHASTTPSEFRKSVAS